MLLSLLLICPHGYRFSHVKLDTEYDLVLVGHTQLSDLLRVGHTQISDLLRVGFTQLSDLLLAGRTQLSDVLLVGHTQRPHTQTSIPMKCWSGPSSFLLLISQAYRSSRCRPIRGPAGVISSICSWAVCVCPLCSQSVL